MPKTTLFQTDLCIDRHYRRKKENREIDVDEFIKPDMTFIMEYTHRKNDIIEKRSIEIIVVSIDNRIEECGCGALSDCNSSDEELTDIYLLRCVLTIKEPIFIRIQSKITLHISSLLHDSNIIATGYVKEITEFSSS